MFTINVDAINTLKNPELISSLTLAAYYKWRVDWYHRDGGDVMSTFIGMPNSPFKKIKYEENLHLMGAGDIELNYIDFEIHSDDRVEVYYNNVRQYRGIVDGEPDPKGDTVSLIPYSQLLEESIINLSFTNQSAETIFSLIIDEITERTGINYNSALVDTGESTLYTINFNYVTAKKAIQTMVDKLDDREWGVDSANNFRVYQMDTDLSYILADGQDKWYSKIKRKLKSNSIKATRYQCLKKGATSGQQERIGQVGYDLAGGSYPTLSIEKLKRRIEAVFTVSEGGVTDTFVKDLAYAKLQKDTVIDETVTINDVRIEKLNAGIGNYIKCIDGYERQLVPFLDSDGNSITDSVDNWTNAALYTEDYVNGSGCVQILGSNPSNSAIIYDFGEILRFFSLEKISFMGYSAELTGNVIEMSLAETVGGLWGTNYQIYFANSSLWGNKCICPAETSFRYMGLRLNFTREITRFMDTMNVNAWNEQGFPAESVIFRFGDFRWYGYGRQEYKGNLVKKMTEISEKGEKITYTLNKYDIQANDNFFELNREIEKIKDVQKT